MTMTINLKIAKNREEWDRLVENSPYGTIFHTLKWLKIVEKHAKSKLYPIIGLNGTTAIGIFPLFYQKKFLIKTVFSPPPYVAVPYLGPLLVNYDKLEQSKRESIFTKFQKKVDEFISAEIKADYISIYTPPNLLDSRPFKWNDYNVEPSYNYLIDLSGGTENVWVGFDKHLRQDINRAKRRGVSIEEGSKKELKFIYDSLVKRYQKQDRIVRESRDYFLELYDSFYPQNMRIFIAKYNGDICSGLIELTYKDKVTSWVGHGKPNVRGVAINDLLQWEIIRWAHEHNFKYYEIVGASTPRLNPFKSKYDPNLSINFYARKYSSLISKGVEGTYIQILKPLYSKLRLMRGQ